MIYFLSRGVVVLIFTLITGVDRGYGDIIIEKACWIKGEEGWFDIYANDHCDDMPDCERLPDEEFDRIMELLGERGK